MKKPLEKKAMTASMTELLTKLIEFQNSWPDKWRPHIDIGDLRKPQNGEISWYSDQFRTMLARIRSEGISLKPHVEKQIRDFAADAGKLGARVQRTFHDETGADPRTYTSEIKQSFLSEGDNLAKRLDNIIPQLEKVFR